MSKEKNNLFYTKDYFETIDRFLLGLLTTYAFFSVVTFIKFGVTIDTYLYLITITFVICGYFIKKVKYLDEKFFKILVYIFLFYLVIINVFLSWRYNNSFKIDYFCFSLMTSLPIVFDFNKEKMKIISMFSIIILGILIMNTINIPELVIEGIDKMNFDTKILKYYNVVFSILFLSFNLYFLYKNDINLENNKKEIYRIKKNINSYENILSIEKIEELFSMAKNNIVLFIEKFEKYFPDESKKIQHYEFSTMDLYVFYLMYLGLDTKEIAIISNSSLKSIESRKYRIKKKIQLDHKL